MSNLLLQKIVLQRVTEVGKIILKKKRPLLLARSVVWNKRVPFHIEAGRDDDVIIWNHFPRNWPFVLEIHRSPVNFPHKGQRRDAELWCFLWSVLEQTVEQTIETLVIWDAIVLITTPL